MTMGQSYINKCGKYLDIRIILILEEWKGTCRERLRYLWKLIFKKRMCEEIIGIN